MRVLICGDRHWNDQETITRFVSSLPPDTTIIEGDAKGADKMAGIAAQECGLNLVKMGADWEYYGRAAGPIRNTAMLNIGPDLVVAFHRDIEASKGTRNMLDQARKAGVPTLIHYG